MNRSGFFGTHDLRKGYTDAYGEYWEFTGEICGNGHRKVRDEDGHVMCGCDDDGPDN